MSTLSSDAVILKYRRCSFVDTISDVFSTREPIDSQEKHAISSSSTSLPVQNSARNFELYTKRECESLILTPLSESTVQLGKKMKENGVDGFESKLSVIVDWDKVNYEAEKEVLQTKNINMCSNEDNQRLSGFLNIIRALKNDTPSWTPYISQDRFITTNKSGCLILLLKRCTGIFYDGISFFSRENISDGDAEYVLQQDAEFALTLPFVPFDYSNFIHCKLLLAIHDGLIGGTNNTNDVSVSFFAVNWEKLGFQGNDPSTDLRSTGIFGLVQLFYLIEYYREFALCLWEMCTRGGGSLDVYEELPFVLIGFNFSAFLLDELKDEKFYADIMQWALNTSVKKVKTENVYLKNGDEKVIWHDFPVLFAACEYHVGCLFLFWEWWLRLKAQRGGKPPTISDFAVVKAKLCTKIKKSGLQFVFDACTNAKNLLNVASFNTDASTPQAVELSNGDFEG